MNRIARQTKTRQRVDSSRSGHDCVNRRVQSGTVRMRAAAIRRMPWLLLIFGSFVVSEVFANHSLVAAEISSEQIRQTAGRVMQHQDFRSVRRRVLEDIPVANRGSFLKNSLEKSMNAIGDFFEWLFSAFSSPPNRVGPQPVNTPPAAAPATSSGGGSFNLGSVAFFLALAFLLVVAMWIIATVIRSHDGRSGLSAADLLEDNGGLGSLSVPPGELAASTYESRALQMAAEGDYRTAVRELLIGSMSWVERAGMIRFRKGLTNRDYLRAVWKDEMRRSAYYATALQFERIYFGRREATPEVFQECLQQFQKAFREEEAATATS